MIILLNIFKDELCFSPFMVLNFIIDVMFLYPHRGKKCMLINSLGYEFYHSYTLILPSVSKTI